MHGANGTRSNGMIGSSHAIREHDLSCSFSTCSWSDYIDIPHVLLVNILWLLRIHESSFSQLEFEQDWLNHGCCLWAKLTHLASCYDIVKIKPMIAWHWDMCQFPVSVFTLGSVNPLHTWCCQWSSKQMVNPLASSGEQCNHAFNGLFGLYMPALTGIDLATNVPQQHWTHVQSMQSP